MAKIRIKGSADYARDYELVLETLNSRLGYMNFSNEEKDAYKTVISDIEYALEDLKDSIAHSEITIEMERGADIPLGEWARRNGLDESYARQKARRGSLKTAHKIGRDWFISELEMNCDNRRRGK